MNERARLTLDAPSIVNDLRHTRMKLDQLVLALRDVATPQALRRRAVEEAYVVVGQTATKYKAKTLVALIARLLFKTYVTSPERLY